MDLHGHLDRRLHDMLDEAPPHDDSARRATLKALPATPQHRFRWLPAFVGGQRKGGLAYAGLTAGVIAFVAAGVLGLNAIDQPIERGAGQPDLGPPDQLHGTILCGPDVPTPTTTDVDGETGRLIESRGGAHRLTIVAMTDSRLEGELIDQLDTDRYGLGAEALEFGARTWTLQNDDGAWTAHFVSFKTDPLDWSTTSLLWTGSGGYEGLSAVTQLDYLPTARANTCGWEMTGYIVDTRLLSDFPEPMTYLLGD